MHELTLSTTIPPTRETQILQILTGLCAHAPCRTLSRHIVYRPSLPTTSIQELKARAQGLSAQSLDPSKAAAQRRRLGEEGEKEAYYLNLVETIEGGRPAKRQKIKQSNGDVEMGDEHATSEEQEGVRSTWEVQFRDVPVPSVKAVNARLTVTSEVEEGDAEAFVESLGYKSMAEYVQEGYQFVTNNVVIDIFRILSSKDASSIDQSQPHAWLKREMKSVDPSGSFVVQVMLRVADGNKPELLSRGVNELTRFKDTMKGSLDLRPIERLSMDTRVK